MTGTRIRFGDLWQVTAAGYRRVADGTVAQMVASIPIDASLSITTDGRTATISGPSLPGGFLAWGLQDGAVTDPSLPVIQATYPGNGRRNVTLTLTDITGGQRQLGGAVVIQERSWQADYSTRHGRAAGVKSEWTAQETGTAKAGFTQTRGDTTTLPAETTLTETAGAKSSVSAAVSWPAGTSGRRVARLRSTTRYPWGTQSGEEFGVVSVAATQPPAHDSMKVPFDPKSWVYQDVSTAPLAAETDFTGAPTQAALVKDLYDQINISWYAARVPALNAYQFTCALAIADANTPRYDVISIGNTHPDQTTGPAYYRDVPIPDYAVASVGTDGHIAIYDPTRDKLWEFWRFSWRDSTIPVAAWGGRIDDVSKSQGVFPAPFGVSASGLAFPAMAVTIAEARKAVAEAAAGRTTKGVIGHALYLATIYNAGRYCWPANRNDGGNGGKLYHGQRVRLSSSVNVDALTAHPVAKAIAHALQKYGAVMADTAGQCNIGAESGLTQDLRDGENPWAGIESPKHDWDILQGIPWDKVEVVKAGWGAPGTVVDPPAPTPLTVKAVEDVAGQVLVTWTPAVTATVSRDGVDTGGGGPWSDTATGSYRFLSLLPGTTYTFTVVGSGQTVTAKVTTKQATTPPAQNLPANTTFNAFTASNGAKATYHLWSTGRKQGDPLLIWLHGDAAYEHKNPTSTYVFGGTNGVVNACQNRGIVCASALSPDTSGTVTWWENSSTNVTYLKELLAKLVADIKPSKVYLAGFSGGAQFITQYYVPQQSATLTMGGGSIVFGGGGKPVSPSNPSFTTAFKGSWWMNWTNGALDDAAHSDEGYDALAYAKAGAAWYANAGFSTSTNWVPNTTHVMDGRFGGWVAGVLDANK